MQPQEPMSEQPPQEVAAQPAPVTEQPGLNWQASEDVQHDKEMIWFVGLFAVAVVLLVVDWLLIKSWTFAALIVVMFIGVVVIVRRPPQLMNYSLTDQGLHMNDKFFPFHDFKAFGVIQEGAMYSVRLMPHRRFMPPVNIFFPPEYGEQIVDQLGAVLPMETVEPDIIDRFAQRIRF